MSGTRFLLTPLLAALLSVAAVVPVTAQTQPQEAISVSGADPTGFAWDGSHFWVLDRQSRLAFRVDPESRQEVRQLRLDLLRPRGLAWDGKGLWTLEEAEGLLVRFDPATGERTAAFEAPKPETESAWSYTGLTWDGEYLWLCISAGWCSSLKKIDPASGEVVLSVFPQCDPRGLATDGERLWTVAYNGRDLPSRLSRRWISGEVRERVGVHQILGEIEIAEPMALTFARGELWALDRAAGWEGSQIVRLDSR